MQTGKCGPSVELQILIPRQKPQFGRPTMFNFTAPMILAIASLFATSSTSSAGDYSCSGAFSIMNRSSVHIYYQVRWGNGDWKESCLAPGKILVYSYELDEDGCTPKPQVRFDWIAGDGCVTYKNINPTTYRAHCLDDAKPHQFKFSTCGTKLTLYSSAE